MGFGPQAMGWQTNSPTGTRKALIYNVMKERGTGLQLVLLLDSVDLSLSTSIVTSVYWIRLKIV